MKLETQPFIIKKDTSEIIKGFAIILMFVHHFVTFPSFIIEEFRSNYEIFAVLNIPTKLCVCIFAFITGWAFNISPKKIITDILKRLIKFLVIYWLTAIPIIIFAVTICGFAPSAIDLILELFGVKHNIMCFCWYVLFYIISMLLIFCLYRLFNKNIWIAVIIGIIVPIVLSYGLTAIIPDKTIDDILNNLKRWFPCISAGYICCRYNIFTYVDKYLHKIPDIILLAISIILCCVGRYCVTLFDFLYCCILVFSLSRFVQNSKNGMLSQTTGSIFKAFGKASTNMWFWHCIIFSDITRNVVQTNIAFIVQYPLIFLLFGIISMFLISVLWNAIDKRILWLLCSRTQIEKNPRT